MIKEKFELPKFKHTPPPPERQIPIILNVKWANRIAHNNQYSVIGKLLEEIKEAAYIGDFQLEKQNLITDAQIKQLERLGFVIIVEDCPTKLSGFIILWGDDVLIKNHE